MEEKTKKYLTYGGVALGGLFLYSRWKKSQNEHDHKDKPKPKAASAASPLAPPTPANMPYSPISLPGAGYAPYAPPYAPPYYPPQQPYPYQQPYTPPYTPGYPYVPPVTSFPGYPSYPPPYVPGVGQPSVIGLSLTAARTALQASGYYVVVRSINGRYPAAVLPPPNIPVAYIDLQGGVVRNVQYGTGQAAPYGYNTYAGSGPAY